MPHNASELWFPEDHNIAQTLAAKPLELGRTASWSPGTLEWVDALTAVQEKTYVTF